MYMVHECMYVGEQDLILFSISINGYIIRVHHDHWHLYNVYKCHNSQLTLAY